MGTCRPCRCQASTRDAAYAVPDCARSPAVGGADRIEAISNGSRPFKEPRSHTRLLRWLDDQPARDHFLGTVCFAPNRGAAERDGTIISQIGRTVYGEAASSTWPCWPDGVILLMAQHSYRTSPGWPRRCQRTASAAPADLSRSRIVFRGASSGWAVRVDAGHRQNARTTALIPSTRSVSSASPLANRMVVHMRASEIQPASRCRGTTQCCTMTGLAAQDVQQRSARSARDRGDGLRSD